MQIWLEYTKDTKLSRFAKAGWDKYAEWDGKSDHFIRTQYWKFAYSLLFTGRCCYLHMSCKLLHKLTMRSASTDINVWISPSENPDRFAMFTHKHCTQYNLLNKTSFTKEPKCLIHQVTSYRIKSSKEASQ